MVISRTSSSPSSSSLSSAPTSSSTSAGAAPVAGCRLMAASLSRAGTCSLRAMVVTGPPRAVVFDWGGTLTPFHEIDLEDLWAAAARILVPDRTAELTAAHLEAWTPHTHTDPEAAPLLRALHERGLRTGLLSNTHWPRDWHERILARDGVLDLIDARVYTSELRHTKLHAEAFRAVLDRLGVEPGEAVMVGDRPIDDVSGAQALGMRTVLLPNGLVPPGPAEPDATISRLSELL